MTDRTEEFKAFVASKPKDEKYDHRNADICALGQFGLKDLSIGNCDEQGVPLPIYLAAVHRPPFTFGALSDRLAAL